MGLLPKWKTETKGILLAFIRHHFQESHTKKIILGLSGGLDSSVVLRLCEESVGPEHVLAVFLPIGENQDADRRDADLVADWAHVELRVLDLSQPFLASSLVVQTGSRGNPDSLQVAMGNLKARLRMTFLYHVAKLEDGIVMGTGNKSELALGYFTKFADGGVDFQPLGDLYKTQVRALAVELGVPESIRSKTPSAGLWEGQTDEGELGMSYEVADRVLLGIELGLNEEEIARRASVSSEEVRQVQSRVRASIHKRKMPLIPKCGVRTFGLDWRE